MPPDTTPRRKSPLAVTPYPDPGAAAIGFIGPAVQRLLGNAALKASAAGVSAGLVKPSAGGEKPPAAAPARTANPAAGAGPGANPLAFYGGPGGNLAAPKAGGNAFASRYPGAAAPNPQQVAFNDAARVQAPPTAPAAGGDIGQYRTALEMEERQLLDMMRGPNAAAYNKPEMAQRRFEIRSELSDIRRATAADRPAAPMTLERLQAGKRSLEEQAAALRSAEERELIRKAQTGGGILGGATIDDDYRRYGERASGGRMTGDDAAWYARTQVPGRMAADVASGKAAAEEQMRNLAGRGEFRLPAATQDEVDRVNEVSQRRAMQEAEQRAMIRQALEGNAARYQQGVSTARNLDSLADEAAIAEQKALIAESNRRAADGSAITERDKADAARAETDAIVAKSELDRAREGAEATARRSDTVQRVRSEPRAFAAAAAPPLRALFDSGVFGGVLGGEKDTMFPNNLNQQVVGSVRQIRDEFVEPILGTLPVDPEAAAAAARSLLDQFENRGSDGYYRAKRGFFGSRDKARMATRLVGDLNEIIDDLEYVTQAARKQN